MTKLYYAERADAGANNNLYTYQIGGTTTGPNTDYEILQMSPQHDLMLVDNGSGDYSVLSVSTGTLVPSFDIIFHPTLKPTLLSQSSTQFIVSGRNAAETDPPYEHYYGTTLNELTTTTDTTFDDYPIVAMMMTSTNFLVVINSLGDVWAMDTDTASTYNSFNLVGRIPNFPDDRDPADMPYPFFIYNNTLILQNENNVFYEITDTTITTLDDTDYSSLIEEMNNIQAKSYLVDGRDLYVGTMQNGIFKIDMPIS